MNKQITISSKNGVSILGEVIDHKGKLGRFTVHSIWVKSNGNIYHSFIEAEREYERLKGVKNSKTELNKF